MLKHKQDVALQDQHTPLVDLYFHRHTGSSAVLTSPLAIDDYILNVESGHGFSAGEMVCIKEGIRFYQAIVLSVTATTITLDTPLDYAYTVAATCTSSEHDLAAANGSPGSPLIYHLKPNIGAKWDIVRIMFYFESSAAQNDGLFGADPALTNGLVLRKRDGIYNNIFNVKTNGEFAQRAYDRTYIAKPPAGVLGSMVVRRTFGGQSKNGVVIRLNGTNEDEFEAIVRDNLTGGNNTHIHIIAQGHIVQD